jgi:hypothetical protein
MKKLIVKVLTKNKDLDLKDTTNTDHIANEILSAIKGKKGWFLDLGQNQDIITGVKR